MSTGLDSRNKTLCQDVDECSLQAAICHLYADCINEPGGYRCRCLDGYVGDGHRCQQGLLVAHPFHFTHTLLYEQWRTSATTFNAIRTPSAFKHASMDLAVDVKVRFGSGTKLLRY